MQPVLVPSSNLEEYLAGMSVLWCTSHGCIADGYESSEVGSNKRLLQTRALSGFWQLVLEIACAVSFVWDVRDGRDSSVIDL